MRLKRKKISPKSHSDNNRNKDGNKDCIKCPKSHVWRLNCGKGGEISLASSKPLYGTLACCSKILRTKAKGKPGPGPGPCMCNNPPATMIATVDSNLNGRCPCFFGEKILTKEEGLVWEHTTFNFFCGPLEPPPTTKRILYTVGLECVDGEWFAYIDVIANPPSGALIRCFKDKKKVDIQNCNNFTVNVTFQGKTSPIGFCPHCDGEPIRVEFKSP